MFDFGTALRALRQVLHRQHTITPDDLPRLIARDLGFRRLGSNIQREINSVIRAAALRGLTIRSREGLSLAIRSLHDANRASLKECLLAAIGRNWQPREDAPGRLATYAGFGRVSPEMRQLTASLINGLLRQGRMETDGPRIRRT